MKKYLCMLLLLMGVTLSAMAQNTIEVSGKVTDANDEPLIGANVTVKDAASLGVITDIDGNYKIKVKQYQTLVFSYIGFEKVEILVKGDKHVINVRMTEEKVNAVDEVVVTALGTQKKLNVTGAITNVNMGDLKHYSSSNITNTLAGNVPGIIAMQSSGQPGRSTSEFWIRGISTFGASSSAYILVDGFERKNIDEINIEDIESFSVLKDASATAIYGSKGANGVILITTKHGKAGKININGKFETSFNGRTKTPEFVDGLTYANLVNEANITRNKGVVYQPEELELIKSGLDPDLYPNVDWKDLLLKDGAWSYRGNINLSGGGNTSRYFASISYVEDQGMYNADETLKKKYDTNANYKRWNYRLNVDIDITPTTVLKLGISGNLNKRNTPGLGDYEAIWGQLFGYNPLSTPIMYSNGYTPANGRGDTRINPYVTATQTGYNEDWTNNIQSNVTLEQNLDFVTKGLRFVGRFGYDTYNYNWIHHRMWPALYKANGRDSQGQIVWDKIRDRSDMFQEAGGNGSRHEFLDLMLSWNRQFNSVHNLGSTVKFTQDANIMTQNLGNDIKNSVARKNRGVAGQVTYNYALRYFLDFNFGYTGSENFADGHRYGFFPAFSLAWNVAEEKFIRDAMPWLNMFKIRFSHGKVGSDNTGDRFPYLYNIAGGYYDSEGEWQDYPGYNWGSASNPHTYVGTRYTQVASPYVTWEIAKKTDLGFDLVAFDNKFSLTMDYFNEKRTGIYMERRFLPEIIGLDSNPKANVGATRSRGFDGNFAYNDHFGDMRWTVRGNITYAKNEILDRDEEGKVYPYQYERGYRINQQRGLIDLGLFKDYDDIRNSPRQVWGAVQPGDIKYKDVNGDGVVDDGDRVAIGATSTPNLIYGLGLSVQWKGIDFNLHFQGAGKSTFPIFGKNVFAFSENDWGNIMKGLLEDRWISASISGDPATENPNASYPRLSYGGNSNNQQGSTFWMKDGRYFRLKNLDIGYTLPKPVTNKIHFNSIRFFVSGQNLLTWSKFKLWDPEILNPRGEQYPLSRSVTMGVQVNL